MLPWKVIHANCTRYRQGVQSDDSKSVLINYVVELKNVWTYFVLTGRPPYSVMCHHFLVLHGPEQSKGTNQEMHIPPHECFLQCSFDVSEGELHGAAPWTPQPPWMSCEVIIEHSTILLCFVFVFVLKKAPEVIGSRHLKRLLSAGDFLVVKGTPILLSWSDKGVSFSPPCSFGGSFPSMTAGVSAHLLP